MGDLNARHINWRNRSTDRRLRQLQDLCTSHQLNIMNENIPTHVSGTSIDMTRLSPDQSLDITWTVAPLVLSSDHFPIIILFNIPHPAVKLSEEGWDYKKGKLEEYGLAKVWSHLIDELRDDSHGILVHSFPERCRKLQVQKTAFSCETLVVIGVQGFMEGT